MSPACLVLALLFAAGAQDDHRPGAGETQQSAQSDSGRGQAPTAEPDCVPRPGASADQCLLPVLRGSTPEEVWGPAGSLNAARSKDRGWVTPTDPDALRFSELAGAGVLPGFGDPPGFAERVEVLTAKVVFVLSDTCVKDSIWPKYFYPTTPGASPYTRVRYSAPGKKLAELSVRASGDFLPSIRLGQLYWARAPEPRTPNGQPVGGNWRAFTTYKVPIETGDAQHWDTTNLDYQFMWESDDAAGKAGIIITYTCTELP
ncbi:hypothetical protein FJY70_03640 [candidate division WOR-3 bacterium]|nr:hypothetical protein [candidate division WOR-3 bacterium]